MRRIIILFFLLFLMQLSFSQQKTITLTKEQLQDKIMGGWAGQTIGVTFGGPYEFRFSGSFIQDYQPLVWYDGYLKKTMIDEPGLYDDLYMDLTFVDVFERNGLNAPVDSFANAFANAGYMLWHANQAARYNILNGIKAPQSGYWMNNPHSDDIDYQIESDFAGLMSPAMPNTASAISDKIGHIMNYGDGWYGGVFVGAMYSLAFTSNNIHFIVTEALKTVPAKSTFYQCISDVIKWHKQHPNDWHQTWLAIQEKWSSETSCPDGVFHPFNIDAKINSAYVVLGLLYGNGDYSKTLEITTRAGQDADCNPSTTGGILGTMIGYKNIPSYWKMGLTEAEEIDFKYTTMSLKKVYEIGYQHALLNIEKNGGKINGNNVTITIQSPKPVKFEQGFQNLYPIEKKWLGKPLANELSFDFEGTGFAISGVAGKKNPNAPEYIFEAELYIDGVKTETARLPANFTTRRHELFWKYDLPNKQHHVTIKILNPNDEYEVRASATILYSNKAPVRQR